MKLLIDDANIAKIKEISEFYPVDGVTTNPSILAKSGRPPFEVLSEIREFLGDKELHVQVISDNAEGMIREAEKITEVLGKDTYIKVPVTREGLKAIKALSADGYKITATAIYTPMQAYLAAKAGADFVAPYVNRLDNIIGDGTEVVAEIVNQLELYRMDCKVLAASFKNAEQVHKCASVGCHSVTVTDDIMKLLISHPMTDAAIQGFDRDWQGVYGDKTILDF